MGIVCRDIADFFEGIAPRKLAEVWDNVGLLAGSMDAEVRRIMLCLDVTPEVVEEAVEKKAGMIISHHPVIFKGITRIREDEPKGKLLGSLIKHGICVYTAHTNLDSAQGGVNEVLARRLGLKSVVNFRDHGLIPDKTGYQPGLGKVGCLEEWMKLRDFAGIVKSALEVGYIRISGDMDANVQKVAVFCGSFDDDLESLQRHGADVLVTGDVKYHVAVDALQMGKCIIDAGHFNTERPVLSVLAGELSKRFDGLEVFCSKVEKDPFNTY